nr:PREDICTED: adenylyltransferase and sulfurtransferase MOCS3 isoform X1 [Bemisia tabaci]XP_018916980.1 PREDICTED: adenylyltransferase and sulfurtransferase MOCS3 isoform X1 [Bemisia tabaci]
MVIEKDFKDPRILQLKEEIKNLKLLLCQKETELSELLKPVAFSCCHGPSMKGASKEKLSATEISRYSRQMLIPKIGVKGQLKLKNSSVLIVGVGGLGCPAALYLAAAGVGCIGLVDHDCVEINNLHRQVLHSDVFLNQPKVDSAFAALRRLNEEVEFRTHKTQLSSSNATDIISSYDVIVDATDNAPTRFLLNDVCVFTKKPLVSGAALQTEGQLTVYNYENGPCYRCLFPKPPPPNSVKNCGDAGVLGTVPGVIGTLQAMEVIKILTENKGVLSGRLLTYDGLDASFRTFKIRDKSKTCAVCSESPTIKELIDYEQFCGSAANDKNPSINLLNPNERIHVERLAELLKTESENNTFIDVRSPEEFEMCSISKFVNVPINSLFFYNTSSEPLFTDLKLDTEKPVYVICRRGNDSQRAVQILKNLYSHLEIKDVIGGLHSWAKRVDNDFPVY